MQKRILKYISLIILIAFTTCGVIQPGYSYAAGNTGTIKIFSEVKGIEIFVDEISKGTDVIEIKGLEPGQHYVKAIKSGVVIYSELITVTSNTTSAILIKSSGEVKAKILESLSKEQQEYKQSKLDILLSKNYQTVGTSYTYNNYYPGYYSIFGPDWTTTSSSMQYEVTDWKIIQGGVQEISDIQFATLVNDKDALTKNQQAWDKYNNTIIWAGVVGLVGICMAIAGFSAAPASDSSAAVAAVGIAAGVIGCGIVLSIQEPSGHLTTPSDAAKKAYEYNQKLKKQLGLPENYESQ